MAKRRILVLSPLPGALVEALFGSQASRYGEVGEIDVVTHEAGSAEELTSAVSDANVIIGDYTFNVAMDADVMRSARKCVLIQQPSTGYQHIDVDAAAARGIPVANVAGANAIAVAEHTIMAMLACLKKLLMQHEKTMAGQWAQDEMATHGVFELYGKTLGIIGMGRIGREVAARARAFGPTMIYYDPNRLSAQDEAALGVGYSGLDDLVAASDVITIHTPLTDETRNMIGSERIAMMKPTAIIVNVARGEVMDEGALAAALTEGRIGGAAIDVFTEEPLRGDNPLLRAPNVILTPHTAGATNESRLRIIGVALGNVAKVLSGEVPDCIVNGTEPDFTRLSD